MGITMVISPRSWDITSLQLHSSTYLEPQLHPQVQSDVAVCADKGVAHPGSSDIWIYYPNSVENRNSVRCVHSNTWSKNI